MSKDSLPGSGLLIAVLMVTQTIGWGTSFSMIGIAATPIGRDLGLSLGFVYSGVTVMLLTGSFLAPACGRFADRHGAPTALSLGSVLLGLALALLGMTTGPVGYMAAWALIGAAMHLALATAAVNAIRQSSPGSPRRGIAILTLATGLSSSIFWPVGSYLVETIGWRETCFVYAAIHLSLCVGAHLVLVFRFRGRPEAPVERAADDVSEAIAAERERASIDTVGAAAPHGKRRSFVLLATVYTLDSIVGTGMSLMLIDIFAALGAPREGAVLAAAMRGIGQLMSRGLDVAIGSRIPPQPLAIAVLALAPLSMVPMLVLALAGYDLPTWLAAASAIAYGLPIGMTAILRPVLLIELFGAEGFGGRFGRLYRPINIASSLAPSIFAQLLLLGGEAVLLFSDIVSALALATALVLFRDVRSAPLARGE